MSWTIVVWALVAIAAVPLLLSAYVFGVERALDHLPAGAQRLLRPTLWLLPGVVPLVALLIYPVLETAALSVMSADSSKFVGLENYLYIFTDRNMLTVVRNNLLWLVVFTTLTVALGLVVAVLADRVKYERLVKISVFLPMAISFVAAGVIWRFMYQYQPPDTPQIGTVNAILSAVLPHFEPQAWLFDKAENNWALIAVGVWMWTGFAMVILSASLKGIPEALIEAARMEGASELQIFFKVTLPLMKPTIAVVTTTLVVGVLRVFDVVYVMTNGNLGTDVIANRMYKEMFNYRNFGRAGAFAMVLLVAIIPIIVINIRRFSNKGGAA